MKKIELIQVRRAAEYIFNDDELTELEHEVETNPEVPCHKMQLSTKLYMVAINQVPRAHSVVYYPNSGFLVYEVEAEPRQPDYERRLK